MKTHEETPTVLCCAECGCQADELARGWRALHGREYPEDQPETLVFCPECAEREFGREKEEPA